MGLLFWSYHLARCYLRCYHPVGWYFSCTFCVVIWLDDNIDISSCCVLVLLFGWMVTYGNAVIWLSDNYSLRFVLSSRLTFRLSCTEPVTAVFYDYSTPIVLSELSCPSCHVLAILSSQPCPGWPVHAYLSHWHLQTDLSWLSSPRFPVCPVLDFLS